MRAQYEQQATRAAQALGMELHSFIVHQAGEFATAFLGMVKNRDQGLLVMSTTFTAEHRREIAELAAKHRIVAIYENPVFVDAGGLMSYGANRSEVARRSAAYVDKILRGAKPTDLPIEQPNTFELAINLKTAKAIGVTVPQPLLSRADRVIE